MRHQRATLILLCTILATSLGIVFSCWPDSALSKAELSARDWLAAHGRMTPSDPKLIYLAIDSESVSLDTEADLKSLFDIDDVASPEGRALTLMSQHWPWPRSVYALVLDRLLAAGAKAVVFDLNFPTPSDDDEAFRSALELHRSQVVIGSNFSDSSTNASRGMGAELTMPTTALIPSPDERVGYVNFWPDADGVIRRAVFQTSFAQFLGTHQIPGEPQYASLAAQAVAKLGRPIRSSMQTASHAIRYTAGPGEGFPPHSIFEIFVPEYWKRNYQSGKRFDGAVVVVGAAGNWQHDEHVTPFGVMAGPEIQLNVINALLQGEFLTAASPPVAIAIWLLAGAVAAGCAIIRTRKLVRLSLLAVALGWVASQIPIFNHFGYVGPVVGPLTVMVIVGLFSLIYDLIRAGAEQLRLRLDLKERKRAQEILERSNEELERRVASRTVELTNANAALAQRIEEKNVLLKEVHHRVKNNLQVISSLLNLQAGQIKDPDALQAFKESRNRVRSMALIHENLYQSKDISQVDFGDYIKALTKGLMGGFSSRDSPVRISIDIDNIMLPVDSAVPCGLIVNELVTNCFKYAFTPSTPGEIGIAMRRTDNARLQLTVSDNGVGFPNDINFRNTESLGMQLVTTLAEQLDGIVTLQNGAGTTFTIDFPQSHRTKL